MEAQRGEVTCLGSHSGFVPEPAGCQSTRTSHYPTQPLHTQLDGQCLVQTQSSLRAPNLVALCGLFRVINCPPDPASLGVSVIVKRAVKTT